MQVVWYKRDLRVTDHTPLCNAAKHGPVCALYIVEPGLWAQPDASWRHYVFMSECLGQLRTELADLGLYLRIKVGIAVEVFKKLHDEHSIKAIHAHQETGNHWTYQRDIAVRNWARQASVPVCEVQQSGVIRCLPTRDGWSKKWTEYMNQSIIKPGKLVNMDAVCSEKLPEPSELGLKDDHCYARQRGGRRYAMRYLDSFLSVRGEFYRGSISSPNSARRSCSRLSPYVAWGVLSVREVYQAVKHVERRSFSNDSKEKRWRSSLKSFMSRLRWHCHFIQKLESQPSLEYTNCHSAYDGLRPVPVNESVFNAWKLGRTGYPLVDACMRSLIATGWLNFRMRAMLVSFATYHLWLDWKPVAQYLAQLFLDYEPGIHFNQIQMQSGTTGINSIRIYNPIKQSKDQDPAGLFIRRWLPELRGVDTEFIHTPWLSHGFIQSYPDPIVDEERARRYAAKIIYGVRSSLSHKSEASAIVEKHASRSRSSFKKKKPTRHSSASVQLDLFGE